MDEKEAEKIRMEFEKIIRPIIDRAIAQDRKEREIEWFCKQCGHPNPIPANLPDPLSARLERLAEHGGIPKDEQRWKWNEAGLNLRCYTGRFGLPPVTVNRAVDAALKEGGK